MEEQVNPLDRDHTLAVVLPDGLEKHATVHGSKPVMDFLVTLCADYHLNLSDYTVQILSPNKNNIRFKPNSPIGSLEAEKIVLKPKGVEEKIRRPYMPEPSVRLLINYNKSHKAVVRVNPKVPMELLMPVVCEKCEFQVETTILLRDSQSKEPLDLSKSLDDHSLREVFAKDTASEHLHRSRTPEIIVTPTEVISPPPLQELPKKEKEKKQKENNGFLSLFRRRKKKKPKKEGTVSAPASPGLKVGLSANVQNDSSSHSNTLTVDMPKKRRAPQPPMGASQSVPSNLTTCHLRGAQRSAESTLRSTKRRAPPPPCPNSHQELNSEVKGTLDSLHPPVEHQESDESDSITLSFSTSSSPLPSHSRPPSSFSRRSLSQQMAEHLPSFRGKDLSDARSALAKVLTSSVSKGTLVKRLKNAATLPKFHAGPSFISMPYRRPENGVFSVEHDPVISSELPTEQEWEDPQRRVLTTFKVVPSKKFCQTVGEITLKVPEQVTVEETQRREDFYEDLKDQDEVEEAPSCLEESRLESSSSSPEVSNCPPCLLELDKKLDNESLTPPEVKKLDRESLTPPEVKKLDSESLTPPEVKKLDSESLTPPEVGETVEREDAVEEEEKPGETSEVLQTEDVPSEAQSDPEDDDDDERDQNPFGQFADADVDKCGWYANEEDPEEEDQDFFPPPPPPVFFSEDAEDKTEPTNSSNSTSNVQTSASNEDPRNVPASSSSPYTSPATQDNLSSAPSRFAQAVALAVQRSRLQSQRKSSGLQAPSDANGALPSSPRSLYQYGA